MRTHLKKITKLNFLKRKRRSVSNVNNINVSGTKDDTIIDLKDINRKTDGDESKPDVKLTIKETIQKQLKENVLLILTVISVAIGIALGFILRIYTNMSPPEKSYFGFPGEVFLRILKFLILPLISSSLISGIAGLGTEKTGKIAARALIFYFCSTFSAVVLGLILVSTIRPGYLSKTKYQGAFDPLSTRKVNTADTILDLIRNLFPGWIRFFLTDKNFSLYLFNRKHGRNDVSIV